MSRVRGMRAVNVLKAEILPQIIFLNSRCKISEIALS
jgi:hypothetical protein